VCGRAYLRAAREFLVKNTPLKKLRLVLVDGPVAEILRKSLAA
jgi:hypothetical protein